MTTADAPNHTVIGVDDGRITAELTRRLSRPPDYAAESRALTALAQEMTTNPRGVLERCAELVLELCRAESAAISLPEPDGENGVFRWHAVVGRLAGSLGGTVLKNASLSGAVIERDSVLLFKEAGRGFPAFSSVAPRAFETLFAPWHSNDEPAGALWAIKHTPEGRFDAEDARLLQSLTRLAAAAHQMIVALDEARTWREELELRLEHRTRLLSEAYENVRASETRFRTALEIETVGVIYLDIEGQIIDANDAFLAMGGYSQDELKAGRLTWQGLTPLEWMEASERALAELKATGRTTPYEKEYFRKDGSRWRALFAAKRLPDGTVFEFVLDLTARKQAEEALAAELKAMTRLHELSRQLVRSANLEEMLEQILDATVQLHGADFGNIQLYDKATRTLRIAVQHGFQQPFLDHFAEVSPGEGSACGMALARRERVVIEDVEQEPTYALSLEVARDAGYQAVQSTPLFTPAGQPLGMLSTHFRRPHRWSERDLRLTDVYARLASDAIAAQVLTQSLRESEERFRAVAEQAEAGIVMVNAEGRVIFANSRFGEIVGRTRDDLAGRTVRELTHPEDWGPNEPLLRRMLTQGEPFTIEKRHMRSDGSPVWVRNAVSPLRDAAGRIVGGFAICIDITERKEAEDALRASEERFQYCGRATRDIIWDIDLVADRVWWSDAMLRQLGYAPEHIGPDTAWCFAHMHPEDRERVVRGMREAAAGTGDTWADEFRYQRADGSYAYLTDRGFILRDAQGRAVRMIGAMQDITERKQAEEALRASEERFRQFGEASTDVLWIRSANTLQWEYLSPAFEAVYGASRERALAGDNLSNWLERIIPEDHAHVLHSINQVRAGERVTFEFRITRPDGQMRWMRDTDFPLLDESGCVQRIGGIGQDITERKEVEEALRQSEERQAFLLKLSDALRPLGDPHKIQREASRVLREHLGGNRVVYWEATSDEEIMPAGADYAADATRFSGRYRLSDYSPDLAAGCRSGRIVSQDNPASDPHLSDKQRAAFSADRTGGWAGVPLVKEGRFVALLTATFPAPHAWSSAELALMQEVAERTWAAVERARAEMAWRRFAALAEASSEFFGMCDMRLVPFYVNAAGLRLVGLDSLEQAQHTPVLEFFFPEDQALVRDEFLPRVLREGGAEIEIRFRHFKSGEALWVIYSVVTLIDEHGKPSGYGTVTRDITERKQAEEALRQSESRARLLLGELQHRVRNTLAVIRSIVRRTTQTSKSVEEYAMHLDGRINAFARVQTAVARDPTAGLDLTELVADELLTYAAHQSEQVRVSGPSVRLKPRAAEMLGLAIHELATNAVKHGALTVPQGRIRVTWRICNGTDLPRLVFEWKECGVPDGAAKRKRRGFGTDLLDRTLTYELKAKTVQTFEPDGLHCTIELPMTERLVMGSSANATQQD